MGSMMASLSNAGLQLPPLFQQASNASDAAASGNKTAPQFPPGMFDTFLTSAGSASPLMQLLLFFYRLLGAQFGIDPSVVLTAVGFLWGLSKISSQVYHYLESVIDRYLMCSMHISEDDRIYFHIMKFMAQHPSTKNNKYLMAQTVFRSAWDDDDYDEKEDNKALFWTNGGDDEGTGNKYLNFSNQAARLSPRFVPALGRTNFWHRGSYFKFFRFKEAFANTSGWGPMKDIESLKISCYGRSIEPIKRLLADAKVLYYQDTSHKTTIYRPRSKEQRRDYNMWQQVARRPVRPIRTVVLDSKEKHDVLSDVNEYLHPATPRWYASRGIPLRRGYLFHGPPGTGKTSFSFALAGVFGIDIYVISLQDVSVTEEDLAVLFTKLPRRCVILLEDIDTAGLRREADTTADAKPEDKTDEKKDDKKDDKKEDKEDKKKASKKSKKKKASKSSSDKKVDVVISDDSSSGDSDSSDSSSSEEDRRRNKRKRRGGGRITQRKSRSSKKGISLSGLLNAIDGVASHEGRVLIMTTNKPESLDEALVRPGRVDVQVGFANASTFQVEELFQRMYEVPKSHSSKPKALANGHAKQPSSAMANGSTKETANGQLATQAAKAYELEVSIEEMKTLAADFAARVPELTLSPAEIQGFLLKRKKSPRKALEDVDAWVEALVKQKETKSKVTTVQ